METYQILIKLLDGRTRCLRYSSPALSAETLAGDLSAVTGVPSTDFRLVTGTSSLSSCSILTASSGTSFFPSVSVLLRLRGGKGGFGSLLRGAATKAGQKKTSNFDACRDMSGRRLRHVNAERRLEEWKAEAEDRRLEKIAEEFIRKKTKEVKKSVGDGSVDKYLEKFRADKERCVGEVEKSVKASFSLYVKGKRKVLPTAGPDSSKKLKIWLGKELQESDSDEEDCDDESESVSMKSVVLDMGNYSNESEKAGYGDHAIASRSGSQSEGDSSGAGSEGNISLEINGSTVKKSPEKVGYSFGLDEAEHLKAVAPDHEIDLLPSMKEACGTEPNPAEQCSIQPITDPAIHAVMQEGVSNCEVIGNLEITAKEAFDLDKYNSASELEVLGMDHLKELLQAHGMKCGGTLQERASRLFLLKTTPFDKLPKKVLLANPSSKGKR